ncbi:MAG: cytochrome b N-terminal domain-containing protein [Gemmatimonadota bacterium]
MTPPAAARQRWRDRLALHGLAYEIPREATRWPHLLGALTLTCILILMATGIYLGQFYQPAPIGAHASVMYVIERAPFGDLMRSLHRWAGDGALLAAAAHLSWVFYRGAYRTPRELTWWAGVGMLACLFLLYFSGTVLPYDQEGFEALAHNVAAAQRAGPLGVILTDAFTPSAPLLARIYSLHVSALPLLLIGLLGAHLYLVRYLGIRTLTGEPAAEIPFARYLRRLVGSACLLAAGLIALALAWPRALGVSAVPGFEITKPPLPFLWLVTLENERGILVLAAGLPLVLLALLAVPLLDRRREDTPRGRRWRAVGVGLAWTLWGLLTVIAALAPQQSHIGT